jgi:P-type Ca2+ transporter type 2C
MQTQLGRIAGLLERQEHEPTPLERRLHELSKTLMLVCLVLVGVIAILQFVRGSELIEVLVLAVSLGVAAVPEGLPAVVTTSLALGLERMVKRNALIRKLPSVETLGSVTTICSDKTGTLTRNEMTVRELVIGDWRYCVTGAGYHPDGQFRKESVSKELSSASEIVDVARDSDLRNALLAAARCTTARLVGSESPLAWTVLGDPTEGALLTVAAKAGVDQIAQSLPMVHQIPFESDRKLMSLVVLHNGAQQMYTKGAPEIVLARSTREHASGQRRPLDGARRERLSQLTAEMAGRAMRILAVAARDYPDNWSGPYEECDLTLLCVVGMIDPPREEAKEAVRRCEQAGIRPIMITGDHPSTAAAIARELGISHEGDVIVGRNLEAMSAQQLVNAVSSVGVYARVSPEHKERIVRALKSRGEIVAMTGDGVNDAPAVSAADIGIAMGLSGTDVTKAASDMVLTDDNFASIVNAVEEGRGIFDNIQRSVHYLLATNAGEVLFMFGAALAGWPPPLLPIQLLWMNLITDGLPALTLGMEPPGPEIMRRPPRDPREGVLTRKHGMRILLYGLLFALVIACGFGWVRWRAPASLDSARTVAFMTAALAQILFAFGCRNERLVLWQLGPWSNRALLLAIAASVGLQFSIVSFAPMRRLFGLAALTGHQFLVVAVLSLVPITVVESAKLLRRLKWQP